MQIQEDRRRRVVSAFVVLAMALAAIGVVATGAVFTDSASVTPNTFTTGTIDISTSPTSAVVSASTMAPGDRPTGALTVSNDGSLELRYAVQSSATDGDSLGLRDVLRMRVGSQAGGSCDFPYYNADGTTTTLTDDSQLYEGLGFAGTPANTVGDATQGSQAGDRTLAGAADEILCVGIVLPLATGNAFQGATTDVTLDFVAEQTANN